jgi:hypothetical protein
LGKIPKLGGPVFPPPPNPQQPLTDLAAFPILTEEVGYPPSPLARGGGTPGGGSGGSTGLGQTAMKAVADVLGWKVRSDDPKGFVGALTQSFALTDVEGHVESKWVQRSYAVQSDLSGGISGAQASLYTRAKFLLDESLPLLNGLYELNPEATKEDLEALREVVRSQMTELVNEFAYAGGPRVSRVNTYFQLMLLTPPPGVPSMTPVGGVQNNSDLIQGTLGNLRDVFGLGTNVPVNALNPNLGMQPNQLVNTVKDEEDATNFRVISDYMTSLYQSWLTNLPYFNLNAAQPFLGTQLVLISRQLSVTSELVDEVRFTMDSVFLGPAERQTMLLNFQAVDPTLSDPMFLEDLLAWIQKMVSEEAPGIIQTGGKFGVYQIASIAAQQLLLVNATQTLAANAVAAGLPSALSAPRVTIALQNLSSQLTTLGSLATAVQTAYLPVNPS